MFSIKSAIYTSSGIAGRIAVFYNTIIPPTVLVEHFDTGSPASVSIKYQESDDGTNWSDIASTPATVNPGESNQQSISSSRAKIALHSSGSAKLQVTLMRQVNGAPFDLGLA